MKLAHGLPLFLTFVIAAGSGVAAALVLGQPEPEPPAKPDKCLYFAWQKTGTGCDDYMDENDRICLECDEDELGRKFCRERRDGVVLGSNCTVSLIVNGDGLCGPCEQSGDEMTRMDGQFLRLAGNAETLGATDITFIVAQTAPASDEGVDVVISEQRLRELFGTPQDAERDEAVARLIAGIITKADGQYFRNWQKVPDEMLKRLADEIALGGSLEAVRRALLERMTLDAGSAMEPTKYGVFQDHSRLMSELTRLIQATRSKEEARNLARAALHVGVATRTLSARFDYSGKKKLAMLFHYATETPEQEQALENFYEATVPYWDLEEESAGAVLWKQNMAFVAGEINPDAAWREQLVETASRAWESFPHRAEYIRPRLGELNDIVLHAVKIGDRDTAQAIARLVKAWQGSTEDPHVQRWLEQIADAATEGAAQ